LMNAGKMSCDAYNHESRIVFFTNWLREKGMKKRKKNGVK